MLNQENQYDTVVVLWAYWSVQSKAAVSELTVQREKLLSLQVRRRRRRRTGEESALTAVLKPGGGLVFVSDLLVLVSDGHQGAAGRTRLEGRGLSVVFVLPFREQVADLLLQLRTDVVLCQDQNPQAGRVVLHHVQEHLRTNATPDFTKTTKRNSAELDHRIMVQLSEPID